MYPGANHIIIVNWEPLRRFADPRKLPRLLWTIARSHRENLRLTAVVVSTTSGVRLYNRVGELLADGSDPRRLVAEARRHGVVLELDAEDGCRARYAYPKRGYVVLTLVSPVVTVYLVYKIRVGSAGSPS